MTPKELLLEAAQRITDNKDTFACCALKEAAGFYRSSFREDELWLICGINYRIAFDKFESLYRPAHVHVGEVWFRGGDSKKQRITALRHTAAMFD